MVNPEKNGHFTYGCLSFIIYSAHFKVPHYREVLPLRSLNERLFLKELYLLSPKCSDFYFLTVLKGQCHKIVNIYCFAQKTNWAPHEQAKKVSRTFSFSRRDSITKFENRMSKWSTAMRTCNFSFR